MRHERAVACGIVLGCLAPVMVFGESVVVQRRTCTDKEAEASGDTFRWRERSPVDYLKMLERRGQTDGPAVERRLYTVCGEHRDWVREQDVAALLTFIDSKKLCPYSISASSSYAPDGRSTVGQEALFLIDGLRAGVFPPSLHSKGYLKRRKEILAWWQARSASANTPRGAAPQGEATDEGGGK